MLCCALLWLYIDWFPISIRLTSLALWHSNDCPSASKATLMNMDKYFIWINYGRLHNHNKAKHNKTVCIFLDILYTNTVIRVPRTLLLTSNLLPGFWWWLGWWKIVAGVYCENSWVPVTCPIWQSVHLCSVCFQFFGYPIAFWMK